VQTIALHREPLGVLRRARARHGPLFTLRLAVAGPVVVAASAEAIGTLLEADPERAHAGEARRTLLPMASPRSSFGGDGAAHRAARQRIAAAFQPDAVARRADAIAAAAAAHADRWPHGRPFRVLPRVRTLIAEAFVRHVLGVDGERAAPLIAAIRRMLLSPGNPPVPLPGEGNDTLPGTAGALFAWRKAPVERLLGEAIDARRARPEGDDVIAAALRSSPEPATDELVDELLPVVMAAQEPPSVAITWLLDRAGRDERAREALLAGGERRDRAVRETLRLRPPALAVLRAATTPLEVRGGTIPAGATAILPIPLLQRDPRAFPDPERFDPDRWAAGRADEAAYLPFGGGARQCIGLHLAQTYFSSVVPAVLERLRLRPAGARPERMVVRATTLVPQRSGLMFAHPA
jgi:cytochrome P450